MTSREAPPAAHAPPRRGVPVWAILAAMLAVEAVIVALNWPRPE